MSHGPKQPSLFDPVSRAPVLSDQPMVRASDPTTSAQAADVVKKSLGKIQRVVLDAYRRHGPMSARQVEQLPELADHYGFSTIRKRVSELSKSGHLVQHGVDHSGRAPITVWRVST